ncbi:MAG: hypothetical protein Q9182_002807 [Xanthomendoza sp. 2 TL-2023]
MLLYLLLSLLGVPSINCYAIAPSCYGVLSREGVERSQWLKEAYDDALRLARVGYNNFQGDLGLDNMRELLFPGIQQSPNPAYEFSYIRNAFARAAQGQAFQPSTNLNDPRINLIFYCGDQGFQSLAREKLPGCFKDPYSDTIYQVGEGSRPCSGSTLAITSQGYLSSDPAVRRYGTIFCDLLFDRGSLQTVEAALEYDEDMTDDGRDIGSFGLAVGSALVLHELFHVTSFYAMLPEGGPQHEDEHSGFELARGFAEREGLRGAVRNIDNYVFYALARILEDVHWPNGLARSA